MGEETAAPAPRPGVARIVLVVVLTCVFAVRAGRWWAGVSAGTIVVDAMSTWAWVKIGFYHIAVLAGVAGTIEMVRARARRPAAELPPGEPPTLAQER